MVVPVTPIVNGLVGQNLNNMVLSDKDIKKAIKDKRIIIMPEIDIPKQLGSCSIDFCLGNTFRVFNHSQYAFIDTRDKDTTKEITREIVVEDGQPFIIQPGDFVLATSVENLELADNLLGRLEGRSSLGRLGIVVHSTASVFDPGWKGKLVLELGNLGRIAVLIYPGMRICSMTFEELSSTAERPYHHKIGAKYVDQKGPVESKIHLEK